MHYDLDSVMWKDQFTKIWWILVQLLAIIISAFSWEDFNWPTLDIYLFFCFRPVGSANAHSVWAIANTLQPRLAVMYSAGTVPLLFDEPFVLWCLLLFNMVYMQELYYGMVQRKTRMPPLPYSHNSFEPCLLVPFRLLAVDHATQLQLQSSNLSSCLPGYCL